MNKYVLCIDINGHLYETTESYSSLEELKDALRKDHSKDNPITFHHVSYYYVTYDDSDTSQPTSGGRIDSKEIYNV